MAESAAGSATTRRPVDRRPGAGRRDSLRVLLVEDADEDAILVQEILNDQSMVLVTLDRVSRASEAASCLRARHYDAVLLDLSLPDSQGLESLLQILEVSRHMAVVIHSGLNDEDTAAQAVRHGAQDYLLKGRISGEGLARAMLYAVERRRTERMVEQQEERFRALVEHSHDAIVLLDRDGQLLYASPAVERICGCPVAALAGQPAVNCLLPAWRNFFIQCLQESLARPGQPVPVHGAVRHQDGGWRFLDGVMVNLLAKASVGGIVLNFRDLTEHRDAKQLFETAIDISPTAMLLVDDEGRIVLANRRVEAIFGYSPSDLLGSPITRLLVPDPPERVGTRGTPVQHPGMPPQEEIGGLHADGRPLDLQVGRASVVRGGRSYTLISVADLTRRKQAQAAASATAARLEAFLANASDGIAIVSPDGVIQEANPRMCEIVGRPVHEVVGRRIQEFAPTTYTFRNQTYLDTVRQGDRQTRGVEVQRPDGTVAIVDFSASLVDLPGGEQLVISIGRDVTARRELEAQLMQSQKMEAIGRLAGGIAHDFNNLLTAIFGFSDLLAHDLPPDSRALEDVNEIRGAAIRAAGLTRQLLAFSRMQVMQPVVMNINGLVTDFQGILARVLPADINLKLRLDPAAGNIRADRGQLEQVLMNLCVNAADAMPLGGELAIETENVELDEEYTDANGEMLAGPYVLLSVHDTGQGMDAATMARAFEPFFTTKPLGRGTGLGLATVYGIVRQSGGHIWVFSEVGKGTTFKIYLPRVQETAAPMPAGSSPDVLGGSETILLAEDDPILRRLSRILLEKQGYKVLEAESMPGALELARTHEGPIHLLVSDVVMPGGNGFELADQLRQQRPELRVLHTSGYAREVLTARAEGHTDHAFLPKPFTPGALARKVRELLDGTGQAGDGDRTPQGPAKL